MACAGVSEAVVVAREETPGDKRLAAYYTAREGEKVSAELLRSHLVARVPEYMAPAAYVRLERLPLTVNRKLDRQALPRPEADAYVAQAYEAPRGEVEEALAEIWSGLLGVERVGRHDNFFELGGHSLLAIQVVARMRQQLALEIDLRSLFEATTLASLASQAIPPKHDLQIPPNGIPLIKESTDESIGDVEIRI
jgi:acyl carrier protein